MVKYGFQKCTYYQCSKLVTKFQDDRVGSKGEKQSDTFERFIPTRPGVLLRLRHSSHTHAYISTFEMSRFDIRNFVYFGRCASCGVWNTKKRAAPRFRKRQGHSIPNPCYVPLGKRSLRHNRLCDNCMKEYYKLGCVRVRVFCKYQQKITNHHLPSPPPSLTVYFDVVAVALFC